MPPKKWLVLYFQDDDTYATINTQSKGLSECMVIEETRTKIKYPQGWYWGDILAQTGKLNNGMVHMRSWYSVQVT